MEGRPDVEGVRRAAAEPVPAEGDAWHGDDSGRGGGSALALVSDESTLPLAPKNPLPLKDLVKLVRRLDTGQETIRDAGAPITRIQFGPKKLFPPIVAVFANNGGGDAQGSPRCKEYDTLSGVYAEFVDQELLPRVELETQSKLAEQAVTFTKDPEGRGLLGGSSGGIASFIAAWYRPDLFRRVIGFSPSFVAQESPKSPEHPLGAWNFHEDGREDDGGIIMKTEPLKPIRVWMAAGTNDYGAGTQDDPNTPYPYYDFAFAIPRAYDKLIKKGYPHVHLDVGTGAGHVDGGLVRATLPSALLWAWRGYVGSN